MIEKLNNQRIEVHSFKWPKRPTNLAMAQLLGEDDFGRWLGVKTGAPWWSADRSHSGIFVQSLVKLVPNDTFWTACFHPTDPVVDVDIVLPVRWESDVLEGVDLELDILRNADGRVWVRDQDKFEQMRTTWTMPDEIVAQAVATCEQIRDLVKRNVEPFGEVGRTWLDRFIDALTQTEGEPLP